MGKQKLIDRKSCKYNNKFGETMFEKFMWGIFPYIFWTMFLGIILAFFVNAYLMVFHPRFIGEWNAELLAPIIEKIKE